VIRKLTIACAATITLLWFPRATNAADPPVEPSWTAQDRGAVTDGLIDTLSPDARPMRLVLVLELGLIGERDSEREAALLQSDSETSTPAKRAYTTKQMGDACEMIVAGELTLAGIPAMRAPDYWPGCDVVAQPTNDIMQRVSVKARTFKTGQNFVTYDRNDIFDWLAIVILPGGSAHSRTYYVIPRETCDERFRGYSGERTKDLRELRIDELEKRIGEFRDNFKLDAEPKLTNRI
jgi:hypothetical protein